MNLSLQLINLNSKLKNNILSGTQKKPLGLWRSKSSPRSKFNSISSRVIEDIKTISELSQNKSFQPLGLWNLPTPESFYSSEKNVKKKGGKI